jgi:plastocyanin
MRLALLALAVLTFTMAACTSAPTPAPIPTATQAPVAAPTSKPAPPATSTVTAGSTVTSTLSATPAPKQVVQVQALDDFFRPENITVTVGTQINWINVGQKKHTVTNDTLFDSDLVVGQTFSYTFDKPGTYQYYCVVHSESPTEGMVGTVTVVNP